MLPSPRFIDNIKSESHSYVIDTECSGSDELIYRVGYIEHIRIFNPGKVGREVCISKYQIAARYLEAERFDACVKVISDVKKESPLVTIHFVKRYVKEHLNQDLSLSQISVVTGYNPTYLSRLFKEQTGETLNRYISRKRMEYIAQLMRDPQISMQQIMEAAGFATRSYFNQFVKKETGLTPKQYRMQLGTQLPE